MRDLYKLKKDGKVVGYMRLEKLAPELDVLTWRYCNDYKSAEWRSHKTYIPSFDTACRYATDDKHGEPVCNGDKVKAGKRVLNIFWDDEEMGWSAKVDGDDITPLSFWAVSQFELVKDGGE